MKNKVLVFILCLLLISVFSCNKRNSTDNEAAPAQEAENNAEQAPVVQPEDNAALKELEQLAKVTEEEPQEAENFITTRYNPMVGDAQNALLRFVPIESALFLGTWNRLSYEDPKALSLVVQGANSLRTWLRSIKSSDDFEQTKPVLRALIDFASAALGGLNTEKIGQMGLSREHTPDLVLYLVQDLPVLKIAVMDGTKFRDMLLPYFEEQGVKFEEMTFGAETWYTTTLAQNLGAILALHFAANIVTASILPESALKTRSLQQLNVPAQISITSAQMRAKSLNENDLILAYLNMGSIIDNYTRLSSALSEILGLDNARFQLTPQCSKEMRLLSDQYPEVIFNMGVWSAQRSYKWSQTLRLKVSSTNLRTVLAKIAQSPIKQNISEVNSVISRSFSPKFAIEAATYIQNGLHLPLQCDLLSGLNAMLPSHETLESKSAIFANVDTFIDSKVVDARQTAHKISLQGSLQLADLGKVLHAMGYTNAQPSESTLQIDDFMGAKQTLSIQSNDNGFQIAAQDDLPLSFEPETTRGAWYKEQNYLYESALYATTSTTYEIVFGFWQDSLYFTLSFAM